MAGMKSFVVNQDAARSHRSPQGGIDGMSKRRELAKQMKMPTAGFGENIHDSNSLSAAISKLGPGQVHQPHQNELHAVSAPVADRNISNVPAASEFSESTEDSLERARPAFSYGPAPSRSRSINSGQPPRPILRPLYHEMAGAALDLATTPVAYKNILTANNNSAHGPITSFMPHQLVNQPQTFHTAARPQATAAVVPGTPSSYPATSNHGSADFRDEPPLAQRSQQQFTEGKRDASLQAQASLAAELEGPLFHEWRDRTKRQDRQFRFEPPPNSSVQPNSVPAAPRRTQVEMNVKPDKADGSLSERVQPSRVPISGRHSSSRTPSMARSANEASQTKLRATAGIPDDRNSRQQIFGGPKRPHPTEDDTDFPIESDRFSELDHEPARLQGMTYESLQDEDFERGPENTEAELHEDFTRGSVRDRVANGLGLSPSQKARLFRSMSATEWSTAGEWFSDQFRLITSKISDHRNKRRRTALEFEAEVARRHEAVVQEGHVIAGLMKSMRQNGSVVLEQGTPRGKTMDMNKDPRT